MIRVSAIEGHRLWAPGYDSEPNSIVALERRTMRNLLKPLKPSTVIDFGCGTGQWLLHFQYAGSAVFGCDACEEMLREAAKIPSLGGRLALSDAERTPFQTSTADLVFCSLSLAYFHNLDRVFREFARTVKCGGFVTVSDLHPDAVIAGWNRSFRHGQLRYEIAHHYWAMQDIETTAADTGLRLKLSETMYFDTPELPIFQRAGKEEYFWELTRTPALFARIWEKPW